jgi:hypothetical protein
MSETKTSTELFIETARAYWLAAGELAEAASRYSQDDFKRQAHRDYDALAKTLKTRIEDWNGNLEPDDLRVSECSESGRVGHLGKCEIFTSSGDQDGRCKHCAARFRLDGGEDVTRKVRS